MSRSWNIILILDTLDFADLNKVHDQVNYLLSMHTLSTKQTLLIKAGVGQIYHKIKISGNLQTIVRYTNFVQEQLIITLLFISFTVFILV